MGCLRAQPRDRKNWPPPEAINKARDTYDRASSAWRDEWSMQQAFAQTWAKLQEAGTLETAGIS